jgi:hypothetical protein
MIASGLTLARTAPLNGSPRRDLITRSLIRPPRSTMPSTVVLASRHSACSFRVRSLRRGLPGKLDALADCIEFIVGRFDAYL